MAYAPTPAVRLGTFNRTGLYGICPLFRFIDWLLALPAKQETLFWREIQEYEEERKMPYITSVERSGLARGRAEGRDEGRVGGRDEGRAEGTRETLRRFIQARFGVAPTVDAL